MADVNINEALDKSLEAVRDRLATKATVKREYGDVPAIACEREELVKILATVLRKLADAIEKSGRITISTWEDEAGVYVGMRLSGGSISGAEFPGTEQFRETIARPAPGERVVYGAILMRGEQIGAIKLDSREGDVVMFKLEFPLETTASGETEDNKKGS